MVLTNHCGVLNTCPPPCWATKGYFFFWKKQVLINRHESHGRTFLYSQITRRWPQQHFNMQQSIVVCGQQLVVSSYQTSQLEDAYEDIDMQRLFVYLSNLSNRRNLSIMSSALPRTSVIIEQLSSRGKRQNDSRKKPKFNSTFTLDLIRIPSPCRGAGHNIFFLQKKNSKIKRLLKNNKTIYG